MSLPKPYYQDCAVTLYHGDCREIVPLLGRFDLVLTDPPYGLAGAATDKNDYASFADTADEVTALVNKVLELCRVNEGGRIVMTPGQSQMFKYPTPRRLVHSFTLRVQVRVLGASLVGSRFSFMAKTRICSAGRAAP